MQTNYSFPYPFFNLIGKDYCEVEIKFEEGSTFVNVQLKKFELPSNISYDIVLEVESNSTYYRQLFTLTTKGNSIGTIEPHTFKCEIQKDVLGLQMDYGVYLISCKSQEVQISEQIYFYEKGDCFGVLTHGKTSFEKGGLGSLIKVSSSESKSLSYDISGDHLLICLPKATYDQFCIWQKDRNTHAMALASVGASCLQYALLRSNGSDEDNEYQDKKWWNILSIYLSEHGYSIDSLEPDNVPDAVNKILGNCVQIMIEKSLKLTEDEDE